MSSVERTISLQSLLQYPSEDLYDGAERRPRDSAGLPTRGWPSIGKRGSDRAFRPLDIAIRKRSEAARFRLPHAAISGPIPSVSVVSASSVVNPPKPPSCPRPQGLDCAAGRLT
jgi:hypothetical protein